MECQTPPRPPAEPSRPFGWGRPDCAWQRIVQQLAARKKTSPLTTSRVRSLVSQEEAEVASVMASGPAPAPSPMGAPRQEPANSSELPPLASTGSTTLEARRRALCFQCILSRGGGSARRRIKSGERIRENWHTNTQRRVIQRKQRQENTTTNKASQKHEAGANLSQRLGQTS